MSGIPNNIMWANSDSLRRAEDAYYGRVQPAMVTHVTPNVSQSFSRPSYPSYKPTYKQTWPSRQPNNSINARPDAKSLTMLLMEGVQRARKTADFVWVDEGVKEKLDKDTKFQFRVAVRQQDGVARESDLVALGLSMRTKQLAKHAAAGAMLEYMLKAGLDYGQWQLPGATRAMALEFVTRRLNELKQLEKETTEARNRAAVHESSGNKKVTEKREVEKDPQANAVAQLQTWCQKLHLKDPVYKDVSLPAVKPGADISWFSFTVELGGVKLTGEGGSKRLAKRQTAEQMLVVVAKLVKAREEDKMDENLTKFADAAALPKPKKEKKPQSTLPKTMSQLRTALRRASGPTFSAVIEQLADKKTPLDYVSLLQKALTEKGISPAEFIEEGVEDDVYNVSVSILDIVHCVGEGDSERQAAQNAAQAALRWVNRVQSQGGKDEGKEEDVKPNVTDSDCTG